MEECNNVELHYGNGGHGGPYPSIAAAEEAAYRLLMGWPSESSIILRRGVGGTIIKTIKKEIGEQEDKLKAKNHAIQNLQLAMWVKEPSNAKVLTAALDAATCELDYLKDLNPCSKNAAINLISAMSTLGDALMAASALELANPEEIIIILEQQIKRLKLVKPNSIEWMPSVTVTP